MTTLSERPGGQGPPIEPTVAPQGLAGSVRPRPTMRDVAALAGVSLKTVSRVVNREAGVSDDLMARVERAALQLDYRPNLTASNLRRADHRTATIGLLIEDVANPYFALMHRGVEEAAVVHGVQVISASLDEDPARERQLVEAFAARRVDGLVLAPTAGEHGYLLAEMRAGLPIVFVDRPPRGVHGDVVLTDNREGSHAAVRRLIEVGHQRIAFIGGVADLHTTQDRYRGYLDAMSEAGLATPTSRVLRDVHSVAQAEEGVRALLGGADAPTALFTGQNLISIGAVRALRALALQDRIAMIGFDDFEFADTFNTGVSVVAQDPRAQGRVATDLLFARMADPDRAPGVTIVPSRFIARGSGELRPEC